MKPRSEMTVFVFAPDVKVLFLSTYQLYSTWHAPERTSSYESTRSQIPEKAQKYCITPDHQLHRMTRDETKASTATGSEQPQKALRSSLRKEGTRPSIVQCNDFMKRLKTKLEIEILERLVCRTIPAISGSVERKQFEGISIRCSDQVTDQFNIRTELVAIADWLTNLLAAETQEHLPLGIQFQIHGIIGLFEQESGHHESATRSYLTAVWIAHRQLEDKCFDRRNVAASLCRLAYSYGKLGKQRQMLSTMKQAMTIYYL
jgi:hypothetical protein